jgi:hypothetical protein
MKVRYIIDYLFQKSGIIDYSPAGTVSKLAIPPFVKHGLTGFRLVSA